MWTMSSGGGEILSIKSAFRAAFSRIKSDSLWILFVARRLAKVDRRGSSAVTTALASLGIGFGVMTLITVVSVMNGFQHSFIDVIMEVSSYHIRVENPGGGASGGPDEEFENFCLSEPLVRSFTPFYEAESLVLGKSGKEGAAMIKAVPPSLYDRDDGFRRQLSFIAGKFDLSSSGDIVIGSELARRVGARLGSEINLYALSGGSDVELFSGDRVFKVTGIFHTGYSDINASFAFIGIGDGERYFGSGARVVYGLKLFDTESDAREISRILARFPDLSAESWKSYNRSFFGALQVEKNMLMFLVFLIFVVVAINIFNGMRRMVYERREDIGVLAAFGGRPSSIQLIFVMQGLLTGFQGALPGTALGLFLSLNMDCVFLILSKFSYYASLFTVMLVSPGSGGLVRENPMFMLYAGIPPRIFVSEIIMISMFGILSSLAASFVASRGVLKMTVAEVIRDE